MEDGPKRDMPAPLTTRCLPGGGLSAQCEALAPHQSVLSFPCSGEETEAQTGEIIGARSHSIEWRSQGLKSDPQVSHFLL